MTNHRSICAFCKTDVLTRDIGHHILKKHEELLFSDVNRRLLHRDKYFTKPLDLMIGDSTYYFCLADKSCIKKDELARKHFKGKEKEHKEVLLQLRETYPLGDKEVAAAPETGMSPQRAEAIQTIVWTLLDQLRSYESQVKSLEKQLGHPVDDAIWSFDSRLKKEKRELPFSLTESDLKKLFDPEEPEETPSVPEKTPPPQTPTQTPPEDDEVLIVPKQTVTLEEHIKNTFTEKDITALSTSVTTGKVVEIPELQKIVGMVQKRPAKTITTVAPPPVPAAPAPAPVSTAPPPPPPPPPDFMSMSRWDRFKMANHNLTAPELLVAAAQMGITPDESGHRGIVQNTKMKRPPKIAL